jgi:hypothetical protein
MLRRLDHRRRPCSSVAPIRYFYTERRGSRPELEERQEKQCVDVAWRWTSARPAVTRSRVASMVTRRALGRHTGELGDTAGKKATTSLRLLQRDRRDAWALAAKYKQCLQKGRCGVGYARGEFVSVLIIIGGSRQARRTASRSRYACTDSRSGSSWRRPRISEPLSTAKHSARRIGYDLESCPTCHKRIFKIGPIRDERTC